MLFIKANVETNARIKALKQARQQFTSGPVTIISVKEV
jgi:hypothetical protein